MADIENVIKAWNCCNPFNRKCKECPYEKDCYHDGISRHMVADAVAMLKSQQAEIERLKPKEGHWEVFTMCANEGTYCSECHTKIFDFVTPPKRKLSMFCPHCGARMSEERISR